MAIIARFRQSGRAETARILAEFCSVCGYNRKYAIQIFNEPIRVCRERPGRQPIYGEECRVILTELWHALGRISSKRIHAALPEWVPAYERSSGSLAESLKTQLRKISLATIDFESIVWPASSRQTSASASPQATGMIFLRGLRPLFRECNSDME